MDKGEKRSLDQMEGGSSVDVDAYVLSANERRIMKQCMKERQMFDVDLKLNTAAKMAALKADESIVSLVSFSGEVMITQSCGFIIESIDNVHTVITSLSLIREPTKAKYMENSLAPNLKVIVHCSDEKSNIGEVKAYDLHYNLLIIKFKSKISFPTANLRISDSEVNKERSFQLRPHTPKNNLKDCVLVVGRYFYEPFELMAALGELSEHRSSLSKYDCGELRSSNCHITRCGDGSPMINLGGEVVGIAYYRLCGASILPIDIAYKWWSHFKKFNESRHPSYGFIASSIYSAPLSTLARFSIKFPGVSNGLLVDKVQPGSNAQVAGLLKDDIIMKCDGKSVRSFLELWHMMWNKVGENVELEVARVDNCSTLSISVMVGEATPKELNKWPRYD